MCIKVGDKVVQAIRPRDHGFDTGKHIMEVIFVNSYTLHFKGHEQGYDKARYVKYIETPVEPNVKIGPQISGDLSNNTKASNPKDSIGDKKVALWLLSPIAKAYWSVAQYVGMTKYGAWNWRKAGVRSSVYLSAMQRHMDAYMSGEEVDPIDKTPHLGHIMACCAILIDAKAAGKLTDDRPPSVGVRETFKEIEDMMEIARKNYGHMTPVHYTINDTEEE